MTNEIHSLREFRVLVTGGRAYPDGEAAFARLAACREEADQWGLKLIVIHGACPTGADHWAEVWCRREGVEARRFPAQWNILGRSAGPRRNQRMVTEGQPDLVLASPGSRGTADTVRRASVAGVLVVHLDAQVSPALSRAVQRVLEAEMITEPVRGAAPVPGATRDDGEDMGR